MQTSRTGVVGLKAAEERWQSSSMARAEGHKAHLSQTKGENREQLQAFAQKNRRYTTTAEWQTNKQPTALSAMSCVVGEVTQARAGTFHSSLTAGARVWLHAVSFKHSTLALPPTVAVLHVSHVAVPEFVMWLFYCFIGR